MSDEGSSLDGRGIPRQAVSEESTRVNHTGSWKYLSPVYRDRVAPCNEGCPVGIDIEGWMNLLREGRPDEAADLLLRENPMPAVTGRVCHHPCETACSRRHFDNPVAIHAVERALGDRVLDVRAERTAGLLPERIAVVGSGPAGLSCAYHLARGGYGVTVFDDAAEPGGMLRQGIPEYRLPRAILDAQIARIADLGVEFRCGVRVGEDPVWAELAGYDAVFLATGAHRVKPLGVPGEDGVEVRPGLEFLKAVNRGEAPTLGRRVVVIGGGNTAIDCARTALRLGAVPVVVYRRTRAQMPAIADEVAEAEREGIAFRFLASPTGFIQRAGRLRGVECTQMRLGAPDASGRRRPVPVDTGRFTILADTVLTAIGEDTDAEPLPAGVLTNGAVATGFMGEVRHGPRGGPLLFAGGDLAGGERSVAHALGAGKRAAIGIERALIAKTCGNGDGAGRGDDGIAALRLGPRGNVSITRWLRDDPVRRASPVNEVVTVEQLNFDHFERRPGHIDRHARFVPGGFAEVNLGLRWNTALEEASRCFNCGVCNRCELCLIFCADVAISRSADGLGFDIDMDYCKGCGICAAECPRGALVMTREDA